MSQGLCPSCGAAVNLTAEQTEDHCTYCRSVVKRSEAEARFAEVKASKAGGALLIADISLANGEYERALSFYDKATEQDDKLAEAWLGRGICLARIVAPHEGGQPRIKPIEAVSSWEIAIQFAANPEAMGRRAAKVIAEVVSADSGDWDENVAAKTCHYMLSWALNRDPKGEFLLKAGAEYYSRAAPFVEIKVKSLGSSLRNTNFYAEFISNYDKFLKALREINPEAAKECDALFLRFQSLAQERFKADQEFQEFVDKAAAEWQERIDNAPSPESQLRAMEARLEFLKGLPAGIVPNLSRLLSKQEPAASAPPQAGLCAIFLKWLKVHTGIDLLERLPAGVFPGQSRPQSKQEPASSAPSQTESLSNSPTTGMAVAPGKEPSERSPTSDPQPQKDTDSNVLNRTEAPPITQTTEKPFKPPANPPKRIPTALCAIFLGWLGVHKFMLGYTKEGIIQLIIGVLCCVSALIGLIEGIIYLTKSDEEFNNTYVQAKKAWF